MRFISVVGRPTSGVRYPLKLSQAIRIAATHAGGFSVGAVVIAERHTDTRSESARLLAKGLEGCSYFISQTVYHAPPTEALLRDYLRDCRGAGVEPRRIVLTFAPCGREKTMAFLRWLGVNVPEATALITAELMEMARDGKTVAEIMAAGREILGRGDVMEGVPEMISMIQVEPTFPDGSKLVTVHQPIR